MIGTVGPVHISSGLFRFSKEYEASKSLRATALERLQDPTE
jgi:hypothetical protein